MGMQAMEEAQNMKKNGHDMRIAMMFLGGKRPSNADSPENIQVGSLVPSMPASA